MDIDDDQEDLTPEIKTQQKTCRVKAMDYLARRDHSEKELIEKLSSCYTMDEILPTLAELKDRGWLLPPEELSKKVAANLGFKGKGHFYIVNYLRQKGLPPVPMDEEEELEKARKIVESKLKDPSDIRRLSSLLKNRGFDTQTLARMIHEIRRNTPGLY